MQESLKFYRMTDSGAILEWIPGKDQDGAPSCGLLEELTANTTDAAQEKHLPVAACKDGAVEVNVGEVPHPMEDAHLIEWVCLQTDHGVYRRRLRPGDGLTMTFPIDGEKPLAVYAYCNLHGLWKTEL